jgi:cephalosporin hydroxylase
MHPFPYFNEEIHLDEHEQSIVDEFHRLYFGKLEQRSGLQISWLGHHTGKVPLDLWRYQELIYEYRPDVIIECGTYWGGSALYLANIMDLIGHGKIVSVDLFPKSPLPEHPRIKYIKGNSTDTSVINTVAEYTADCKKAFVILDSDHHADHVLAELRSYEVFVPSGGMIIVEDTFLGGNPSHHEYGKGPSIAIDTFLSENPMFSIEKCNERFLFTLNRGGYLRRL